MTDSAYKCSKACPKTGLSRDGSIGLGLHIAKSNVQEHGGKIWVESNDNGDCFCVQLPCE